MPKVSRPLWGVMVIAAAAPFDSILGEEILPSASVQIDEGVFRHHNQFCQTIANLGAIRHDRSID